MVISLLLLGPFSPSVSSLVIVMEISSVFLLSKVLASVFIFHRSRNIHRMILGDCSPVSAILCISYSTYLAVGYDNGNLNIYELMNSKQVASIKAHDKPIRKLLYNLNTNIITTISEDGYIKFWELRVY